MNPNRLVSDFLPLLQRVMGETVALELTLDPQLDPTRVDPSQFQAALLNLAVNARDAMPSGGRMRIKTRNVALGPEDLADMPEARPGGLPLHHRRRFRNRNGRSSSGSGI